MDKTVIHVNTMESYSALNKISSFAVMWMDLDSVIQTEINQKNKYGMCVKLIQSCPSVCDPVDCSPPGSSVHGILQARILEWVAMPSSKGSSQHWDQTLSPALAGGVFNTSATWEARNLWPNLRAADRGGSSPRPPTSTLLDFIQRVHQKP